MLSFIFGKKSSSGGGGSSNNSTSNSQPRSNATNRGGKQSRSSNKSSLSSKKGSLRSSSRTRSTRSSGSTRSKSNGAQIKAQTLNLQHALPKTRRDEELVEILHDTPVVDPYRWLEDPDSEETKAWVIDQNKYSQTVLESIPHRAELHKAMEEAYSYEKFSCIEKVQGKPVFMLKDGLRNQPVIYRTEKEEVPKSFENVDKLVENGDLSVILDPNTLKEDGTAALSNTAFSPDGKYLAYNISNSGSDWVTIYIRDLETGNDLPDAVEWVKFSDVTWSKDSKGFFYTGYPLPGSLETKTDKENVAGTETDVNSGARLYYHRLFMENWEDVVVFATPEFPARSFICDISHDGSVLLIEASDSTDPVGQLWYADLCPGSPLARRLEAPTKDQSLSSFPDIACIDPTMNSQYRYRASFGRNFIMLTNRDADRNRIICMRFPEPVLDTDQLRASDEACEKTLNNICEIVCETSQVLDNAFAVGVGPVAPGTKAECLVLHYLADAKSELKTVQLPAFVLNDEEVPIEGVTLTEPASITMPDAASVGSIQEIKCSTGNADPELFFKFVSFSDPGTIYSVCVYCCEKQGTIGTCVTPVLQPHVKGLDLNSFSTEQKFFRSKDGTKIPMFLVRAKESSKSIMKRNIAPCPTLLYGYGGFNITLPPMFNVFYLLYIKHYGGVYVSVNMRGGGEYGTKWHKAGTVHQKQNVFDDFIAAGEHLVQTGVTTPEQLSCYGRSNGGLLIGAAITQRPDLFAAAAPAVGVLDMLRFHKFTIGSRWCGDYGCADSSEEEFRTLYRYSPVHRAERMKDTGRTMPAVLVMTADHDDRVVPLHSHKFTASLQHSFSSDPKQVKPIISRIESNAGHGAGKPTSMIVDEYCDLIAFLAHYTGASFRA